MRATEFAAELVILLIEGPQDKKASVDLYYGEYRDGFPGGTAIAARLRAYLDWIERGTANLAATRYRRPVDFYGLIGALDNISGEGKRLRRLNATAAFARLGEFERRTRANNPTGDTARYLVAASRQTDNITPRTTRIQILERLIRHAK